MKLLVFCGLLAVALAATTTSQQKWLRNAEHFRNGREYIYRYKSQIASGIGSLDQHSIHLISSDAHISFESDRVATLQLKNIRVGVRNEMIAEPHRIQPSQLFEEKNIDSELLEQLQMPLRFDYVDGMVENIRFNERDTTWSKNAKRAVLNLLQVNLSRRNAQDQDQSSNNDEEKSAVKMFNVEETTIEGKCKTSYTLNPTESRADKEFFNVTKSIDFSQCRNVPFIRYGPRIELPIWQPHEEQRQKIEVDRQQQLDRSTVWDMQLSGSQSRFGVARSQVVSQYVYRLMNAQSQSPMRTMAVSQIILEEVRQRSNDREVSVSQKEDSLIYSLEWDTEEKRFYELGDAEFTNKKTPFHDAPKKVEMIQRLISEVAKSSWDQVNGITSENALRVQEITELVRMCTMKELRQVRDKLAEEEQDLFTDLLAIAGTRNTLHFLTTEIMKKDIPVAKAIQAFRQLNGHFAVSSAQVEDVLKVCKHEVARRSNPLRQSCWLTFGSMVNELCKDASVSMSEEAQEKCSNSHKNKYHKAMMDEYNEATTMYEKVLALKTIGNAGLQKSIHDLEKIITERKDESPIVRQQAIDSLRRYRNQMPRKVQRILMPLLQNTRERPELRMTALSMIMYTSPDREILDQLTHLLFNERSQHFRSFVYSTLKVYSESPVESERDLAMHLQAVLPMVNIDEDELRASRMWRVPIYSQAEREGLLINLAAGYASGNILPQQMSLSMDTILNALLEQKNLELTMTQTNLEQLFSKLWDRWDSSRTATRGDRSSSSSENGRELLENIFSALKIQRGSTNKDSLGMICLRIRDVDYFVLPLSEESLAEMTRDMTPAGFINTLREKKVFKINTLASLHERVMKIATSAGLPIRMSHYMPVVASIEGDFKLTPDQKEIKAKINMKPMISTVHSQRMEMWSPIVNTGVETLHKLSLNTPINMEIKSNYNDENSEEKLRLTYNLPEKKLTVMDVSSLPLTFIRPFNYQTKLHRDTTIKTIRNPLMDSRLVEIRSEDSEDKKSSLSINGFYHTPSEWTYRNWYSLATINEHHITVDYEFISGTTPKSFDLTLNTRLFQEVQDRESHRPSFQSFFQSTKNRYETIEDDEDREISRDMDNFDLESESSRRSNFRSYISDTYRANKVYQHNVNAVVKSNGGRTEYRSEVDLKAVCDSKLTFCKLTTEVKSKPIKNKEWTMKSQLQVLAPEYVNDVEDLKDNKQNKLAITLDCEFGFDKKETLKLQIEGERAIPQQWKSDKWHRVIATAFINKYEVTADYNMAPSYRRWVSRGWDLFKLANYFNMPIDKAIDGKDGEITATIVIDPLTRKYVNMTVKTPREYVRINNIALPMSVKPFTLIRPQEQSFEIHSASGLFSKVSDYSREECRVDGRKIRTFDSVVYKAPLGKCYSVIAKDCVDKTFAVLMKTVDKETQQKKVKIITRQDIIELERLYEREFSVKVNGRRIQGDDTEKLSKNNIDYSDEMIRVTLPQGVVVKFDGKQATVKLSQYYQNSQCGLCGTMNDEEHDEFRKSDDTLTDDVKEFHRSFSMIKDDEECEEREGSKLYEDDSLFDREMPRSSWNDEDEEESRFEADEDVESYGHFDRKSADSDDDEDVDTNPIMKTQIVEYNHKLCFSLKGVKRCPKGTSADRTESIKVQYTCLNRSKPETRRLLRQARTQDITSQLDGFKTSFVESVTSAISCN